MKKTQKMTRIAMIAAIYAVITFATFFMSFGAVQYRISEALTVLPVFTASAIPGLGIGCALANLIGALTGVNPVGYIDALFGTLASVLAAISTYYIGKIKNKPLKYSLAPVPPVLFNAIIVGFEISYFFVGTLTWEVFLINAGSVLIGQAAVCYLLGVPLMIALERKDLYKKIF